MPNIQQKQMIEVFDRYKDIFAYEPNQLDRISVVQNEIHTEEGPSVKHEFISQEIKRMKEAGNGLYSSDIPQQYVEFYKKDDTVHHDLAR
ncbi:1357_t:CDS:2, partial [Cetraspora pellucida]